MHKVAPGLPTPGERLCFITGETLAPLADSGGPAFRFPTARQELLTRPRALNHRALDVRGKFLSLVADVVEPSKQFTPTFG
jgi:hypothetical protein